MWYVLILLSLLLPLTAYVKMKSLARLRRRKTVPLIDKLFANEPAVVFSASLVLVVIALFVLFSAPGVAEVREVSMHRELAWKRLMAQQLGAKLAASMKSKGKVLLIDSGYGEPDKRYHQALVEGLMEGLGDKGELGTQVYTQAPDDAAGDLDAANSGLTITSSQLDRWQREHDDCSVIVSFVGVPTDYQRSTTMYKALEGKLAVGVYTTTVYTLGETIVRNGITACVVPRQSYVDETLEPDLTDPARAFDNRYLMIDKDNITDIIKENRRIFKTSKVIY